MVMRRVCPRCQSPNPFIKSYGEVICIMCGFEPETKREQDSRLKRPIYRRRRIGNYAQSR